MFKVQLYLGQKGVEGVNTCVIKIVKILIKYSENVLKYSCCLWLNS